MTDTPGAERIRGFEDLSGKENLDFGILDYIV